MIEMRYGIKLNPFKKILKVQFVGLYSEPIFLLVFRLKTSKLDSSLKITLAHSLTD
ncbi:hypothetical protein BpHYR1_020329 [Brachionus plicatilis]|uniref:Uncharacterized protein n=1 Tax=Brachionus plicatilis TaxID=10195 RepID=A0A3M7SSC2_BRAPC|nr:hypothetical protein BpHYR1_020329 [Brachionus plicatilis]